MKILIINPNTNADMTAAVERTVKANMANTTEASFYTPTEGIKAIESAEGNAIATAGVIKAITENKDNYDGFMVACGSDPGLIEARKLTNKPIVGIGESGMTTACALASKFSVLSPIENGVSTEGTEADIAGLGLTSRLASVRGIGKNVSDSFYIELDELVDIMSQAGKLAVEEDGAGALFMLCAGMTGTKERLEKNLGVPVVDGVITALKTIEQFPVQK